MFQIRNTLFFLVVLLTSCVRESINHDGMAAPFLEIDDALVDSLMRPMDIRQKIGQLIIWQGTPEDPTFPFLSNYLKDNQLAGYQLSDIDRTAFIHVQDTCKKNSFWPPLVFHDQPLFVQNNFNDVSHFPDAMQLMATDGFEGFSSFWDHSAASGSTLGLNLLQSSPLEYYQQGLQDSSSNLIARNQEELLRNCLSEMNAWREEQSLSFVGDIGSNIYNPKDSTLNKKYSWRTLNNLMQSGVDGLVIERAIFMNPEMEVILPDFLGQYFAENFEYEGLKLSKLDKPVELVRAYLAGIELLVTSVKPELAFQTLLELVNNSIVAKGMLNDKVRKVIKARLWLEKNKAFEPGDALEVFDKFDSEEFAELVKKIKEESTAVVYNRSNFLPIKEINKRFRIVDIGREISSSFGSAIEFYADAGTKFFKWNGTIIETELNPDLLTGRPLILLLNNVNLYNSKDSSLLLNIKRILSENESVLVNIGQPFNLQLLDTISNTVIQTFQNDPKSQRQWAELVFGGRTAIGQFPVEIDTTFSIGKSIEMPITRIRKGMPIEAGLDIDILKRMDLIAKKGISDGAFPGCQFAVVKDGMLVYEKAYGHLDSAGLQSVEWNHLYDLASVSKVAGTALVAMREYENKSYNLNDRIRTHLDLENKNRVGRVRIQDLLSHRSGIQVNMPITPIVYPKGPRSLVNTYTSPVKEGVYQIEVAKNFYFNINSRDSIWERVENLRGKRRRLLYSDVNFMLLQRVFETKTQLSLDQYLEKYFYRDLGLRRTAYKPLRKFKVQEIAPTAHDRKWRHQELRGYVHDEAAALEGGVGGNAGLFSNARDVAIIGQLLLNKGVYGGKRYLKEETIKKFTKSGYGNHRGLAFNKKTRKTKQVSKKTSKESFGHTGYTGTLFWVDPKEDLIFVFNTNRIHPKVNNNINRKGKYRQKMHDAIYRALEKEKDQSAIPLRVNLAD